MCAVLDSPTASLSKASQRAAPPWGVLGGSDLAGHLGRRQPLAGEAERVVGVGLGAIAGDDAATTASPH